MISTPVVNMKMIFIEGLIEIMLTHVGTMKIETDRLILRKFEYKDDENMLKYWISDPKIQSLYSEPVYNTKQEVKEVLDKYISSYERDDYYRWAIILKGTGECILIDEQVKAKETKGEIKSFSR